MPEPVAGPPTLGTRPVGEAEVRRRGIATEGIGRFLHGTPAIPALRAAEAGLDIVTRAGVAAIRAKSLRQTERILDRSDAEGWTVRTPRAPERRGGVVSVAP